jgi:hypothetical protein
MQNQSALNVEFYLNPMVNERRSRTEGREVIEDVEFVSIRIPGSPDIRRRPATDSDRLEYRSAYGAFKSGKPDGTPLETPGLFNRELIAQLHHIGCRSVEHLAGLSDVNAATLHAFRKQAREWLEARAATAAVDEQARRDAEVSAIRADVAELKAMFSKFMNDHGGENGAT